MASFPARTSSKVEWVSQSVSVSGLTIVVARLRVQLYLSTSAAGPPTVTEFAWVDTGAPLSGSSQNKVSGPGDSLSCSANH